MDFYRILNVSKSASQEEIKRAYRKLSRKYHPDNAGADARDMFEKVQQAYAVLSDEEKRRAYDRKLEGNIKRHPEAGKKERQENNYGDLAAFFGGKYKNSFEQFFGAAPGKQKEDTGQNPVNTDKLFESFFKFR